MAEFLKTNVVDTADGELTANMVSWRGFIHILADSVKVTVELPLAVSFAENTPEGKKEMARQYDFLLEEMFKAKVFAAVVSTLEIQLLKWHKADCWVLTLVLS